MSSSLLFQYTALPGADYVRLLRLRSEEEDGDIAGSLEAYRLDEYLPNYHPLLYSWGRDSDGDDS